MAKKMKNGLTRVLGLSDSGAEDEHPWAGAENVDPNRVLDGLLAKMQLENDSALAAQLQVIQPIIRMIREGTLEMSTPMLLGWIQEATGIETAELRELIANARPR